MRHGRTTKHLLLGVCLVVFSSCAHGPEITFYGSDPKRGGMEFGDGSWEKGFLPYSLTDKFVCVKPEDLELLLNYFGMK